MQGTYSESSVSSNSNLLRLTKTESTTLSIYIAVIALSISFMHHFSFSEYEHRNPMSFLCCFEETILFLATQGMCSALSHNLNTVSHNSLLRKIIHSFILSSVHSSMVNLRATQSHASATRDPLQSCWKICEQPNCFPLIIHRLSLEVSVFHDPSLTGETKESLQAVVLVFSSKHAHISG